MNIHGSQKPATGGVKMPADDHDVRATRVQLCLDCGKCTAVCPVARHEHGFNPRLIVQQSLDGSLDIRDERIWSCLSCHMCVERCNCRVQFPDFVRILRTRSVSEGMRPVCTHGEAVQGLMRLMAGDGLRQQRLAWLPRDVSPQERSETIFFTGCAPYFDVAFAGLGVRTLDGVIGSLRLLNRAGIPFSLLPAERCCGRDLLLAGDRKGFLSLAGQNIAEFARNGVTRIITGCAECQYALKVDYPRETGAAPLEVLHISEVIAGALNKGVLRPARLEGTVTYHDPCTLGRQLRVFDAPRQALAAVPGLRLAEMEAHRESALCCGGVPWVHCGATNKRIQLERLFQARATGARKLVTACTKCQIHLECAQKDLGGDGIEIVDLASILADSMAEELPNPNRKVTDG